jgi:hypothetical protein
MTLPAYMTQDSVASATTMRLSAFMKHAKTATGASSYFKTLLNIWRAPSVPVLKIL